MIRKILDFLKGVLSQITVKRIAFKSPFLFLFLYLIIGFATIKQYGLPIDDFTQYVIGKVNYEYVVGERQNEQIEEGMRYYGPAFETLCFAIDCEFDEEPQPTQKWGMRHGLLFLLFTIALSFLFYLVRKLYQDERIAWIIMLMLAFYPRIFADAHYNSKDTLFLSLVTIASFPLILGLQSLKIRHFIIAGIVFGLAATIRVSAFFVIPSVVLVLLFALKQAPKIWAKSLIGLIVFVGFWFLSYYVFFPALWKHPISEFITLIKRMQEFPWPNETLIAGQWVGPNSTVWWYLPLWFVMTMPVAYLVLFLGSLIAVVMSLRRKIDLLNVRNRFLLFLSVWFFSTVLYVVFTKPNLYDSWRQFQYMIVPFLILIGIFLQRILSRKYVLTGLKLMLLYQLGILVYMNPFQQVYFNEYYWIFGKTHTYDQDYWHVSTEHCVDWLDQQKFNKPIYLYTRKSNAAWLNLFFYQNNASRQFFATDSVEKADYEIVPVRNNEFYDSSKNEVYCVKPLKDTIARIIKLK